MTMLDSAMCLSPRQRPCSNLRSSAGLTLIEVLVTITIMGILLAIAVPSFQEVTLNSKLDSTSSRFVASANLARSESIKRNSAVSLCTPSTTTGTTCAGTSSGGWGTGWIVLAGTDVVARESPPPDGFVLNGLRTLVFQPSGVGTTAATMTVCRSTPSIGAYKRTIDINITGRINVAKDSTSTCP